MCTWESCCANGHFVEISSCLLKAELAEKVIFIVLIMAHQEQNYTRLVYNDANKLSAAVVNRVILHNELLFSILLYESCPEAVMYRINQANKHKALIC